MSEYEGLKESCLEAVKAVRGDKTHATTGIAKTMRTVKNQWAIVFGWVDDYDKEGSEDGEGSCVCGKVAYCPENSLMHEFDCDWLMPCNTNGDVDDTMLTISLEPEKEIDWLISEWDRIKKKIDLEED